MTIGLGWIIMKNKSKEEEVIDNIKMAFKAAAIASVNVGDKLLFDDVEYLKIDETRIVPTACLNVVSLSKH